MENSEESIESEEEPIEKYLTEFYETGSVSEEPYDIVANYAEADSPLETGHWIPEPDEGEFDPDFISEEISESRYEKLQEGAKPTKKEIELWRDSYIDHEFGSEAGFDTVYIFRIQGESGREMYCVSYHDDEGDCTDSSGPFATLNEARDELNKGIWNR